MNPAGCGAAGRQDGSGPLGLLGTGSTIRKCIDRMQNPTYVVHVGPVHHAPGLVLSCRAPSTCRGARDISGFADGAGICGVPQGTNPSQSHAPTQHLHVHTHRLCSTHMDPPHTHTCLRAAPAGLGEDVWAQKPGCLYFPLASFLQLALQATGREPEPLSSHTSNTHARGRLAACPELSCKR